MTDPACTCFKCGHTFSRVANLAKHQQTSKCGRSSSAANVGPAPSPIRNAREAVAFFESASDLLRSFLNPNLFPSIAKGGLIQRVSGMSQEQFHDFCSLFQDTVRLRFLSKENRVFLYLKKLRHGLSFESLAFEFNISAHRACAIFWEIAAEHYRCDPCHPRLLAACEPSILLKESVVTDEFALGVFHPLLHGKKLVLLIGDHTYFFLPKSSCHHAQARTYSAYKSANVTKKMALVNSRGHIIYCGPLTGSISPTLGDGNLVALQLDMEASGCIAPDLMRLLCSGSTEYQVVAIFDKGYCRQPCSPTNINFIDFVQRESRGSTLLMFPTGPGDKVLNEGFRFVKNPVPAMGRPIPGKLTALEANTSRCATMFRYVVECSFAAIKQDKCINERHEPYQWLQSASFCERSRLDVVIENSMAKFNRIHPGFESHKQLPPSWSGLSLFDFGQHFMRRVFLANEFDEIEQVRFTCDLTRLPSGNSRIWTAIDPLDPVSSDFPRISQDNLMEVSVGPYQLKQSDNYIQNIRVKEVLSSNEADSWHEFESLTAELPSHLKCWKFRQEEQPANWSRKFGHWNPSWIYLAAIYSRHKSKTYRVILRISDTPVGNRFGFRDSGLQLLHGYYSSSKAGSRTAGCDCHVMAVLKVLGCYAYDPKAYRMAGARVRFVDSALPRGLIGNLYGVTERQQQQPRQRQSQQEPYQQPHNHHHQEQFHQHSQQEQQQQSHQQSNQEQFHQHSQQEQQQQSHQQSNQEQSHQHSKTRQSGFNSTAAENVRQSEPQLPKLAGLLNRGLQCYANVVAQLFYCIDCEVNIIEPVRGGDVHFAIRNLMKAMPAGNASVERLLDAVRSLFPQQFAPRQQHCVNELLQCILPQLHLRPGSLSEFSLVRACRDCLWSVEELPPGAVDPRVLSISLQQFSGVPLSLDGLFNACVAPQNGECENSNCPGECVQEIIVSTGRITLLHIDRAGLTGQKLHTRVCWSSRAGSVSTLGRPIFTASHHGGSLEEGHYTCCVLRDEVWNKIDDTRIEMNWNPFVHETASIVLVAVLQL